MDDPDAMVPVGLASHLAGIPERTLRNWVAAGKLPAIDGPRGKLVRLGDVRALAELTGRSVAAIRPVAGQSRPATDAATLAGQVGEAAGHGGDVATDPDRMAAAVGAMLAPALAAAAEREAALARALGRAEAERDALRAEVDRLRSEQVAPVAAPGAPHATEPAGPAPSPPRPWWRFWGD